MNEKELRTWLLVQPVPDEHFAEERTWETVRAAFVVREPVARRRRFPWLLLLALVVIGAGVAIAFSPLGSRIGDSIRDNVGREEPVAVPPDRPPVVVLPAPGRLLTASDGRIWIVNEDGSRADLGDYGDASWSPTGLFVAAWTASELVTLDPDEPGFVHWTISGERVADARWSASGFRIAYRSGRSLRVVVENGTGDRELVALVADVAPAWRPGRDEILAYADPDGRIVVIDADSGKIAWRTARAAVPVALAWTDGAERLAVLGARELRIFESPKKLLAALPFPDGATGVALAARPGSQDLAFATFSRRTGQGAVFVSDGKTSRLVFAGAGRLDDIAWSPDGELLLIGWRAADAWLFVPADSRLGVTTLVELTQELSFPAFPRVKGWCCERDAA